MRKSRVLLAGVVVVGAAVTTSAFTAANDVQDTVAGYGSASVSGATTKHINYVLNGTDKSKVDAIEFELNEDLDDAVAEGLEAWLQLENSGSAVGLAVECDVDTFAGGVTPVTCSIPGTDIDSFDGVALTVAE